MFNTSTTNAQIITALRSIEYDRFCRIDHEGIYFRFDTDVDDVEMSEDIYFDIQNDLKQVGLRIDDPCIEHDCISGDVVLIENQ